MNPNGVFVDMLIELFQYSINTNPTNFRKFIKKQHSNFKISKTLTLYGALLSKEQDAVDKFALYFTFVYSCEVINDGMINLGIPFFY